MVALIAGAVLPLSRCSYKTLLSVVAIAALVAYGAALILLGVGFAKHIEPETSLEITPNHISYRHRKGSWKLAWESILRFDIPHYRRGLEHREMPYIGFRLNDIDAVLRDISPRLAVYLMLEQRSILVAALRSERPDDTDFTEFFDPPSTWSSAAGIEYNGILAAFAHRMQHLRTLLGYDLFIPETALDRPLHEFKAHLVALQTTRHQFKQGSTQ